MRPSVFILFCSFAAVDSTAENNSARGVALPFTPTDDLLASVCVTVEVKGGRSISGGGNNVKMEAETSLCLQRFYLII